MIQPIIHYHGTHMTAEIKMTETTSFYLASAMADLKTLILNANIKMVQEILKQCTVEGNVVKLPVGQLDRKIYMEVAKSLQGIGGSWKGGKVMGFVFNSDPTELLEEISGGVKRNLKKEFQFFATPPEVAEQLVILAELEEGDSVLEPSAGHGAIIKAINNAGFYPDCYELMEQNRLVLNKSDLKFMLRGDDFLRHAGTKYDKIIANPPFTKNQDIDHVMEMYECLKNGGRLVSIMSESWTFGSQIKQKAFKEFVEKHGFHASLPKGTFKSSGTQVGAVIVVINKPW